VECSGADPGRGLGTVERFRRLNPKVPVIALAVKSSEDLAVAALRMGVRDYIRWPDRAHELNESLDRCLSAEADASPECKLIGQSPQIREVPGSIQRAATAESNVLVTGEPGTGKDAGAE